MKVSMITRIINKTCSCKASEGQSNGWSKGSLARSARTRRTFFSVRIPRAAASRAAAAAAAASLPCNSTHLARVPPSLALPPSLSSLHLSLFLSLHHPPPSHASALAIASATAPLADSPLRVPPPPPSLRRHASRPSATVGPCPTSPAASSCARAVTDWISPSFTALTTPPLFSTTLAH